MTRTIDPAVAHDRAKKAAKARHSVDTYVDSIVDHADELQPEHISRIVRAAPHPSTWTPEQLADLQRLFGPLVRAAAARTQDEEAG